MELSTAFPKRILEHQGQSNSKQNMKRNVVNPVHTEGNADLGQQTLLLMAKKHTPELVRCTLAYNWAIEAAEILWENKSPSPSVKSVTALL